ncbi:MAG: hypothetical protein ACK2UW_14745 [Anaerolineales bacterium]
MHTRPFDWRDLPKLHSYRNDTLYLNKALLLTRGPLQTLGAMLASIVPTVGIFTAVAEPQEEADQTVIGQTIHHTGDSHAYISFLAPEQALNDNTLTPLVEQLVVEAGGRGILRILADLDERSPVLEALRNSGFAVYMRQRIWQLGGNTDQQPGRHVWRIAVDRDLFAIRVLYANLVPGLVQQVEPVSLDRPKGLVYYKDDELMAYVELRYGLRGIWARPYIHPDIEEATHELVALLLNLPSRRSRPVYVCISAYQSWLDGILEDLDAHPSPRQVLLVKHLTVKASIAQAVPVAGLEAHPETFAFSELEPIEDL